jgi:hypothetical protein
MKSHMGASQKKFKEEISYHSTIPQLDIDQKN